MEAGIGKFLPVLWVLGWAAIAYVEWRRRDPLLRLSTAAIVSLLLTPMAWFQNYVLLLPFIIYLFAAVRKHPLAYRFTCALALLSLYLGLELIRALCGQNRMAVGVCQAPTPLWSLLIAIGITVVGGFLFRPEGEVAARAH
jgi:hypothetical protein